MIFAIKKVSESNERLMSRFKKIVQRSRVLQDSKKSRYHSDEPTKRYVRMAALKRASHRARRKRAQFYS